MSKSSLLIMRARDKGLRIAAAESCTGGLLSAELSENAGSSDVFECGFVTYSNRAKQDMLGVSSKILDAFGAVSEEAAKEMAEGALARAGVDIAVAITGIAGPGGSDHKPEGRVCFALAHTGAGTRVETVEFGALGRKNVRQASAAHALTLLVEAVG